MEITVQDFKAKRDAQEDLILLDVRTDAELDIVSLPDHIHIPVQELPERVGELDAHKDAEIICMCHHGMRSAAAQGFLLDNGFTNVLNLTGGIHAYAVEVDQSLAVYR